MSKERSTEPEPEEVPDGAAVFPLIPPELGVHPLTLAVLHATIFLAGSDEEIVDSAAADEAVQRIVGYLHQLDGRRLKEFREDLDCLARFARQEERQEVALTLRCVEARHECAHASDPRRHDCRTGFGSRRRRTRHSPRQRPSRH